MTASDEAKKALIGVTPGPWSLFNSGRGRILSVSIGHDGNGQRPCIIDSGGFDYTGLKAKENVANARFIAWSREGVPALLAEIAAKDAEIARLREAVVARLSPQEKAAILMIAEEGCHRHERMSRKVSDALRRDGLMIVDGGIASGGASGGRDFWGFVLTDFGNGVCAALKGDTHE